MLPRRRFLACSALLALGAPAVVGAPRISPVRLGLVADPQYADADPAGTRHYRQSIAKLTEAVDHFNAADLAACFNLGDLIDRDWSSYEAILGVLARSRHRFYHALGNHDFEVADAFKARVPARLGLRRAYYAVRLGSFRIVVLNTTDVSPYAQAKDSGASEVARERLARLQAAGAPNAHAWNGAVGTRQLRWFEETCRQASQARQRVIVLCHHPVFPPNAHNAWNADELLALVTRHRHVGAWLNGHNHAGALGAHEDLPFVTLKGMVETPDTNAYATLTLHQDHLELTGHGREPSRTFAFRSA